PKLQADVLARAAFRSVTCRVAAGFPSRISSPTGNPKRHIRAAARLSKTRPGRKTWKFCGGNGAGPETLPANRRGIQRCGGLFLGCATRRLPRAACQPDTGKMPARRARLAELPESTNPSRSRVGQERGPESEAAKGA